MTLDTEENIAEARRRIIHHVSRYKQFEVDSRQRGDDIAGDRWRHVWRCVERDLLGLGGCTIAAFDERCPEVASWLEPVPGRPRHGDGEVWR